MRLIGPHIRIDTTIFDAFIHARRQEYEIIQFFLVHQKTQRHIKLAPYEIKKIMPVKNQFKMLVMHGAYWINICATDERKGLSIMAWELRQAERLGCTHYVLHCGFLTPEQDKQVSIDNCVRALEKVCSQYPFITFFIENTAHRRSLGTDFADMVILKQRLAGIKNIRFCIDTAHAYAAGYDIITDSGQAFIDMVESTIGIHMVGLIHMNDTSQPHGNFHDEHVLVGQGNIGLQALASLVTHNAFVQIPIIMELPLLSPSVQRATVDMVKGW